MLRLLADFASLASAIPSFVIFFFFTPPLSGAFLLGIYAAPIR
jgi:hypothetical protein